jgi:hypothetical protein
MRRHQFTIFVEDAQEYTAVFTSFRRHFGKQKMGMCSLDHNKKSKKVENPSTPPRRRHAAGETRRCGPDPAAFLDAGGIIWQCIPASGRKER